MDAKQILFEHYDYINKIVSIKSSQYDLDYDECLNYVLNEISRDDQKKIRAFKGKSKFTTFITVVVNRLVISFARKQKKLPDLPLFTPETPLDILLNRQQKESGELFAKHLPGWLAELEPTARLIVQMKYFKNLSISRISAQLGMNRYEINKKLDSILDHFRNKAEKLDIKIAGTSTSKIM